MVIRLNGNRVWMVIGLEGDRKVRINVQYLKDSRVITKKKSARFYNRTDPNFITILL
jgi:hypothetical protein